METLKEFSKTCRVLALKSLSFGPYGFQEGDEFDIQHQYVQAHGLSNRIQFYMPNLESYSLMDDDIALIHIYEENDES